MQQPMVCFISCFVCSARLHLKLLEFLKEISPAMLQVTAWKLITVEKQGFSVATFPSVTFVNSSFIIIGSNCIRHIQLYCVLPSSFVQGPYPLTNTCCFVLIVFVISLVYSFILVYYFLILISEHIQESQRNLKIMSQTEVSAFFFFCLFLPFFYQLITNNKLWCVKITCL